MRALPLALLAACASVPPDEGAVRDAIARAWHDHLAAVKRKDPAAVGLIYADDVVYIVPGEREVRGRKAIDEMEAKGLASAEIGNVAHATEALLVRGDVAYEIGTVAGPVRPHGQPEKIVTFRYVARWKREPEESGGRRRGWRIQHMIGEPEP